MGANNIIRQEFLSGRPWQALVIASVGLVVFMQVVPSILKFYNGCTDFGCLIALLLYIPFSAVWLYLDTYAIYGILYGQRLALILMVVLNFLMIPFFFVIKEEYSLNGGQDIFMAVLILEQLAMIISTILSIYLLYHPFYNNPVRQLPSIRYSLREFLIVLLSKDKTIKGLIGEEGVTFLILMSLFPIVCIGIGLIFLFGTPDEYIGIYAIIVAIVSGLINTLLFFLERKWLTWFYIVSMLAIGITISYFTYAIISS